MFEALLTTFVAQTSLFLSSLPATSTELSIRTQVLQSLPSVQPTQLKSVVHVAKTRSVSDQSSITCQMPKETFRCAFVNFKERATAETAAQAWANGLEIDGERIPVKWGRSRPKLGASSTASSSTPSTVEAGA